MKKYRFPLETVLRVRRIEEDRVKAELLAANRAVTSAHQSVDRRAAHLDAVPPAPGGTAATFMRGRAHQMQAAASLGHARGVLVARQQVAAERRDEWSGARSRVASLERLDDRMRDEHAIEANREDQRLVDDLVSARFARRGATA